MHISCQLPREGYVFYCFGGDFILRFCTRGRTGKHSLFFNDQIIKQAFNSWLIGGSEVSLSCEIEPHVNTVDP